MERDIRLNEKSFTINIAAEARIRNLPIMRMDGCVARRLTLLRSLAAPNLDIKSLKRLLWGFFWWGQDSSGSGLLRAHRIAVSSFRGLDSRGPRPGATCYCGCSSRCLPLRGR